MMTNSSAMNVGDILAAVGLTAKERSSFLTGLGARGGLLGASWVKLPGIYKLLLGGTGTVAIDVRDMNGTIILAGQSFDAAGPRSEYPYFGDQAYEIRATCTGTATAEIV